MIYLILVLLFALLVYSVVSNYQEAKQNRKKANYLGKGIPWPWEVKKKP